MGQVAVIGAAKSTDDEYRMALSVGRLIAEQHENLLCGGLGGVMEAACKGASEHGGLTVGIVSGSGNGNEYLDVVIRTGLGHARNVLVVQSADAVIAIGGSHGTLSEIAVALKLEIPVFGLKTWDIPGVVACTTPEDAVIRAVGAARRSPLYNTRRAGSGPL
ncbi:TIGR00725 family protein [uncultured Methanoregula sp.]|uniref:TIGR00725 family protein n=1 Tax=uncultured Methanoregula sp. TaxID=1005933 RepID=UPI002AAB0BD9|nr:TIGR00725 family protein [uncultured Methanoregula sp.]